MAIKGKKYKSYSEKIKTEAILLHVMEKWTYRKVSEHLCNGNRNKSLSHDRHPLFQYTTPIVELLTPNKLA